MPQDDVRTFFQAVSDPRDKALFALIYYYGLRVSEVALLRREDVDFARHRIIVKRVKGGLWNEQPLFSRCQELLEAFQCSEGTPAAPLFPGQKGPLRKRQIQALFGRHRRLAGLPDHYTCHCLRHSIATHLLDAGLPLEFV
jgi:integrase